MLNAIIFISMFTILCIIQTIVCLTGGHVCYNGTIEICCSNFEIVNNSCQECENGSTSKQGEVCLTCRPEWYGHKCANLCNCARNQRCDSVKGCVDTDTDVTYDVNTRPSADEVTFSRERNTVHVRKASTPTSTTDNTAKPGPVTIQIHEKDKSTAYATESTSSISLPTQRENTPNITSRELTIYCVAVALLLLVMGLCYGYQRHRLKSQNMKLAEVNSSHRLLDVVADDSENIELEDEIYHVIDESKMEDFNQIPSDGYLEVIDSPSHHENHQINGDGGYLMPYEVEIHKHDINKEFENSSSSEANSSLPYTDKQGYFHMYQQLQERSRSLPRDYEYTTHIRCSEKMSRNRNSLKANENEMSIYNVKQYQKEIRYSGKDPVHNTDKNTEPSSKHQEILAQLGNTPLFNKNARRLTL